MRHKGLCRGYASAIQVICADLLQLSKPCCGQLWHLLRLVFERFVTWHSEDTLASLQFLVPDGGSRGHCNLWSARSDDILHIAQFGVWNLLESKVNHAS